LNVSETVIEAKSLDLTFQTNDGPVHAGLTAPRPVERSGIPASGV